MTSDINLDKRLFVLFAAVMLMQQSIGVYPRYTMDEAIATARELVEKVLT